MSMTDSPLSRRKKKLSKLSIFTNNCNNSSRMAPLHCINRTKVHMMSSMPYRKKFVVPPPQRVYLSQITLPKLLVSITTLDKISLDSQLAAFLLKKQKLANAQYCQTQPRSSIPLVSCHVLYYHSKDSLPTPLGKRS